MIYIILETHSRIYVRDNLLKFISYCYAVTPRFILSIIAEGSPNFNKRGVMYY